MTDTDTDTVKVAGPDLWRDPTAPVETRVDDLMARMTLEEKVAQLSGLWGVDPDVGEMAPMLRDAMGGQRWDEVIQGGLGQLTRPFGSAPVEPADGVRALAERQRAVVAGNRFGIPAQVHEEILTGLAAWRATIFPSPLCWAAAFDPGLVERMGAQIGETMRLLGIHQGMAPVVDVVRDLRWGRVEETMGEDPFLVGLIGSAYVRGVQSAGVVATVKHFAGYSASRGARNLAPVSMGPRELMDVIVPPFEMVLRAGVRSVMNSYTDLDGVPTAADPALLTDLLRDTLGFTGTVASDYFSVAFLETLHHAAGSPGEAAGLALAAGIDVELPSVNAYGEPLLAALADGLVDESLVDRALCRVLAQKCELGLLDDDWAPAEPAEVDLDPPASRAVALELARRSVVLLANDGTLPLRDGGRVAVVGPRADTPEAMLGCYSFPRHVLLHHSGLELGVEIPTVREALAQTLEVTYAQGCPVLGGDDEDIAAASALAAGAEVCVAVLGDEAGLFGNGTSGEGCDAVDLRLPGRQEELLEALLGTGTPVVVVLLVGRPYDLSRQADRLAGLVCGFFPGEEGGRAVAEVLSGRVNPTGRLPVGFPGSGTPQPAPYFAAALGQRSEVTVVDPTPLFPFGHGLSYVGATWEGVAISSDEWDTDGTVEVEVRLANEADRPVSEVVQVYLHDRVASVVRPVQQLVAVARVDLEPRRAGCGAVRAARRPDVVHRAGPAPGRRARRGRAQGRGLERRHPHGPPARAHRAAPPRGRRAGAGAGRHRHRVLMHYDLPLEQLWDYRATVAAPPDLTAFWHDALAGPEPDATTFARVESGLVAVETYDVTFAGSGGDPVRAWLHLPAEPLRSAPLPGVVQYQGYNGGRGLPHEHVFWATAGFAHLVVDTRGQGSGWTTGATPDPVGSGPAQPGFLTKGIEDPRGYFYRRAYVDAVRALGVLRAHGLVDSARVAVAGESQGGGLALAVAALASRDVAALLCDVPFLCDFRRAAAVAQTEPYLELVRYLASHRDLVERVFGTLAYFDGAVLGPLATAPALFSVGLMDLTCPPSTVFGAFHSYGGTKEIEVYPYNDHEGGEAHHRVRQLAWLRDQLAPPTP